MLKLLDHINLEWIRLSQLNKKLLEINNAVQKFNDQQKLETEINIRLSIEKATKDIPVLLVTLLGVFSALLTVVFTGISTVSSLVSEISKILNPIQILLIIAFVILGMGTISCLLLHIVSKMCSRNFLEPSRIVLYLLIFAILTLSLFYILS